jgi:hypothetical protein
MFEAMKDNKNHNKMVEILFYDDIQLYNLYFDPLDQY